MNDDGLIFHRHGHYQSAVMGWKPYLCVDISNTAFYSPVSIEETIKDLVYDGRDSPAQELDRYGIERLTTFLKGVKVSGRYNLKISYLSDFIQRWTMLSRTHRHLDELSVFMG